MLKRSLDIPTLRRRAKKMMRKKYKKTIRLSDFDDMIQHYIEYGVVYPLIKYGSVQVDSLLSVEIVGIRVQDHKSYALLSKGLIAKKNFVDKAIKVNKNRLGVIYKIQVTDTSYKKGKLIFEADKKLSKRVNEHLNNTPQHYRIT